MKKIKAVTVITRESFFSKIKQLSVQPYDSQWVSHRSIEIKMQELIVDALMSLLPSNKNKRKKK